jgi:hypothetical protein
VSAVAIERAINKEIDRQTGGRGKVSQKIGRVSDRSAELAGFGKRETEKEKSPVAYRAFPVLSPVKASSAKKSVTNSKWPAWQN